MVNVLFAPNKCSFHKVAPSRLWVRLASGPDLLGKDEWIDKVSGSLVPLSGPVECQDSPASDPEYVTFSLGGI